MYHKLLFLFFDSVTLDIYRITGIYGPWFVAIFNLMGETIAAVRS